MDIVARTAAFEASLTKVERRLAGFSKAIKGVAGAAGGALAVGGFGTAITRAIELGDSLDKAATKAGVSAKAISELAYAAKMADVDLNGLSAGLREMQKTISEASSGSASARSVFQALGLTLRDLQGIPADRQMEVIADRIAQLKDPADKTRASLEVFGRAGADLLPLFEEGAAGLRKAREEAERFGHSFDETQLKALANADDAVKRLGTAFETLGVILLARVAPPLTQILNDLSGMTPAVEKIRRQIEFLDKYKDRTAVTVGMAGLGTQIITPEENAAQRRQLQDRLAILEGLDAKGRRWTGAGFAEEAPKAAPPGFTEKATARTLDEGAEEKWRSDFERKVVQPLQDQYQFQQWLDAQVRDAMDESNERMLDAIEQDAEASFDRISTAMQSASERWSVYADEAARGIHGALADFLFDPFKNGLEGMVKGFADAMRRMIAEAAAAQILERSGLAKWLGIAAGAITGSSGNTGSAGGMGIVQGEWDWFDKVMRGRGGWGGARAAGGPVAAGSTYLVGERGPELFTPRQSGAIVPNHKLGGGGSVIINNHIDARGATMELQKALPSILADNNRKIWDELDRRYGIRS